MLELPRALAPQILCELLCDRLVHDVPVPSRTCPLLDARAAESNVTRVGAFGSSNRYKWSAAGVLVRDRRPFLRAHCSRLGDYGSQWDGLHIMRVERVFPMGVSESNATP